MTNKQLEVLVREQKATIKAMQDAVDKDQLEYLGRLEAAVLVFSGFGPHLERAEIQRNAAVDIGVVTARLRVVVDLGNEIYAREGAKEAPSGPSPMEAAEASHEEV